jgi:hypothetical protein
MFEKLFDFLGQSIPSVKDIKDVLKDIFDKLPVLGPDTVELLTYGEAIEYFVNSSPPDLKVNKGIMLRQPHAKGFMFVQVFLDEKNNLLCKSNGNPYGRRLIVKQFDEELTEHFADKDLIVVE